LVLGPTLAVTVTAEAEGELAGAGVQAHRIASATLAIALDLAEIVMPRP
jgi:hypothetical protein